MPFTNLGSNPHPALEQHQTASLWPQRTVSKASGQGEMLLFLVSTVSDTEEAGTGAQRRPRPPITVVAQRGAPCVGPTAMLLHLYIQFVSLGNRIGASKNVLCNK